MWTLISGLVAQLSARREAGVLLVGLESAGKTTLLERLRRMYGGVSGEVGARKVCPTVGCNLGKLSLARCELRVWDLGGRADLREIWARYYAESRAVLFCLDAADPVHWQEAKTVLESVLRACPGVPVVVVACKADVPGSQHRDSVASFFKMAEFENRMLFVTAAALPADGDRSGITEAMAWLEMRVLANS